MCVTAAARVSAGIVYGLYLTLSTWVLYYVATKMNFFENQCHLPSLNNEARASSGLCCCLGEWSDHLATSLCVCHMWA